MTFTRRLSLLVAAALIVTGVVVGALTAFIGYRIAMSEVDRTLNAVAARASAADDPVDGALDAASGNSDTMYVSLALDDSSTVSLAAPTDGSDPLANVSLVDVVRSELQPVTVGIDGRFRIVSVGAGDGQWVVVGRSIEDLVDNFITDLMWALLTVVVITGLVVVVLRIVIRRSLAPLRDVADTSQRIAAGDLTVTLTTDSGPREIRELNGALADMVESLRSAVVTTASSEARMREFLGDMAHDLRTPLTVVAGYADMLASGRTTTPEQRERAVERMAAESGRMAGIIDDLLLLAENDVIDDAPSERVELARIVGGFVDDLRTRQPDRMVTTQLQPVNVLGNKAQLSRMVANLVANIERHTPPTAAVTVSLSGDSDVCTLIIDDAGPGLSADSYRRAADGFQRFDRSRSDATGHFGLGLSLVASVVRHHGGTLSLTPSPEGGLRTMITLRPDPASRAEGGD